MPRGKRIWFPGAVYHVMARGNNKKEIFQDDSDHYLFLGLMRKYAEKCEIKIHAYCLMRNHYHMLIETGNIPIWQFMKVLNATYALYYNNKYNLVGHLFQGRYKACIVKNDSYFLQVSRYIHLNPVKAGIVMDAAKYKWSSFRFLIGKEKCKYVETKRTYDYFYRPIENYTEFVRVAIPTDWENAIQEDIGEEDE